MTPANRTKLEKASRELHDISQSKSDAQNVTLALFRTMELIQIVMSDLVFRPEVNTD